MCPDCALSQRYVLPLPSSASSYASSASSLLICVPPVTKAHEALEPMQ